jgi:hypothetical protein
LLGYAAGMKAARNPPGGGRDDPSPPLDPKEMTMSELSVLELEEEVVETLPSRELMCGCGCGGGNVYQVGLINLNDINIAVL